MIIDILIIVGFMSIGIIIASLLIKETLKKKPQKAVYDKQSTVKYTKGHNT